MTVIRSLLVLIQIWSINQIHQSIHFIPEYYIHIPIDHLPVPKINSPGGADTASGEYTLLRSAAWAYVTAVYIQYNEKFELKYN